MMPRALPPAGFAAEKKNGNPRPRSGRGWWGIVKVFFFSFDAQMSTFTPLPREILTHTFFLGEDKILRLQFFLFCFSYNPYDIVSNCD